MLINLEDNPLMLNLLPAPRCDCTQFIFKDPSGYVFLHFRDRVKSFADPSGVRNSESAAHV